MNTLCLCRPQVATTVQARSQNRIPAQLRVPIVINLSITTCRMACSLALFVGSTLRYIRRRAPAPKVRPIRRVETAVGAQVQIDWVLGPWIYIEEFGGRVRLQAFLMILSHSRMWSVIWSVGQDILLWLDCQWQCPFEGSYA